MLWNFGIYDLSTQNPTSCNLGSKYSIAQNRPFYKAVLARPFTECPPPSILFGETLPERDESCPRTANMVIDSFTMLFLSLIDLLVISVSVTYSWCCVGFFISL